MRIQTAMRSALAAAVVAALAPQAGAQPSAKLRYVTLEYQKPAPGKTSEYVGLEGKIWKPIHQDRVRKGAITSWKLYNVRYPNGASQEYDYVTVTEYPSFAAMESPYEGTDMKAVLGDSKYNEMRGMTSKLRTLVRQDVFAILLSTEGWSSADSGVLEVVFLQPLEGRSGDLRKVQRELFQPMNEDQVKANAAAGWATMSLRYPQVHEGPYGYVSFNAFKNLAQMDQRMPKEMADKWAQKWREGYVILNAARKRVRGELWVRVDQTDPK